MSRKKSSRILGDVNILGLMCFISSRVLGDPSKAKCLLMLLTKMCSRVLQPMHVSESFLNKRHFTDYI